MDASPLRIRRLEAGTSFELPPRPIGAARHAGWVLVLVALGLAAVIGGNALALLPTLAPSFNPLNPALPPAGELALVVLFVLVVLLLPAWLLYQPLFYGLYLVFGHDELVLARDRLTLVRRAGLLRKRRHFPTADLDTWVLITAPEPQAPLPSALAWIGQTAALSVRLKAGPEHRVAWVQPERVLTALLAALAEHGLDLPVQRRVHAPRPATTEYFPAAPVHPEPPPPRDRDDLAEDEEEDVDPADETAAAAASPDPPPDSTLTIVRHADGLAITAPAPGFWAGTHGFGCVGVAFAVIPTGVLVAALAQFGKPTVSPTDEDVLIPLGFGALFAAVGYGLLYFAIRWGSRRTVLAVTAGTLVVQEVDVLGRRMHRWAAADVSRVTVEPSGMKVNDRDILQFQIHPVSGRPLRLLSGRSDAELAWTAATLSAALRGDAPATA